MHALRSPHCHRRLIGTAGGTVITMIVALSAYGGVTLDGTLGPAGALPGPDYQIGAELGKQVGGNLFRFGQVLHPHRRERDLQRPELGEQHHRAGDGR